MVDFVLPTGTLSSHTSLVDGQLRYFEPYDNSVKPWSTAVVADLNSNGTLDVIAATAGSPGLSFLNGTGGPFPVQTHLNTQGPVELLDHGRFRRRQDLRHRLRAKRPTGHQ